MVNRLVQSSVKEAPPDVGSGYRQDGEERGNHQVLHVINRQSQERYHHQTPRDERNDETAGGIQG